MKQFKLDNMIGGWFVGDFTPSVYKNKNIEVGIKYYQAGDKDPLHVHHETWEVTVLLVGRAIMAGQELNKGDILLLEPGDESSFEALEDSALVVVKYPSLPSDKLILEDKDENSYD